MDDLNYRVQVVNQNCCYNQPPHLSVDPAVAYEGNPNQATQEDGEAGIFDIEADNAAGGPDVIYNLQGIRLEKATTPGIYIINGKKTVIR